MKLRLQVGHATDQSCRLLIRWIATTICKLIELLLVANPPVIGSRTGTFTVKLLTVASEFCAVVFGARYLCEHTVGIDG